MIVDDYDYRWFKMIIKIKVNYANIRTRCFQHRYNIWIQGKAQQNHQQLRSWGILLCWALVSDIRAFWMQQQKNWLSKRFKTIQWLPCLLCLLSLLALRASVSVKIMAQPKPSLRGVKANVTPLSWAKMELAAGCSLHQLEEKRYYRYCKKAELRLHPVHRGQWASKICSWKDKNRHIMS